MKLVSCSGISIGKDNRQALLADIAKNLLHQRDELAVLRIITTLLPRGIFFNCVQLVIAGQGNWQQEVRNPSITLPAKNSDLAGRYAVSLNNLWPLQGELIFIRHQGGDFSDEERKFLYLVADLAGGMVFQLSQHKYLLTESQSLRKKCECLHILVDITNSVLAHDDIKPLFSDVSREIYRFFGINYIAFAMKADNNADFDIYASCYAPECAPEEQPRQFRFSGELLKWPDTRHTERVVNDDDEYFHQIPALFPGVPGCRELKTACLLPLISRGQPLGVLILAHQRGGFFTKDKRELLEQITARVAIATGNVSDGAKSAPPVDQKSENTRLKNYLQPHDDEHNIIYQSQAMARVMEQIELVAASESTVLILGETGTGKELVAREIHRRSQRNNNTMVKINCAAVPENLLESDLFGHEKGAFTGAISRHIGRFEMANEGTLFLDEIGDMPLRLQPKLLRVLQEREIERLGSSKTIPVHVRLIAATNRDLKQMSVSHDFRSDLYYRLNVFPIYVPSLRERPEDIPLLANYFMRKIARSMQRDIVTIPEDALQQLVRYPWPGNIRELQNVIERAVILTTNTSLNIQLQDLQMAEPVAGRPEEKKVPLAPPPENDEKERLQIIQALRETNGIVAGPRGAALRLGLKRTTLLSRMQRLGISVDDL